MGHAGGGSVPTSAGEITALLRRFCSLSQPEKSCFIYFNTAKFKSTIT